MSIAGPQGRPLPGEGKATMGKFPLSHVRQQREIGGPLPVEYVELVAWFYPATGDGVMALVRRREDGTEAELLAEKRVEHKLGPFDADIWVPRMAHSWISAVRRMTNWATLDGLSGADSPLDGDD